jgi:hypothetical protein
MAIGILKSRFFDIVKLGIKLGNQNKYVYLPALLLASALLLGSCSSSRNAYPYKKKRKKKKCDCPEWSYNQKTISQTNTFVLS